VFSAAVQAGETGLALVGVLGSVISVYYYLRVIVAFYMRDVPEPGPAPEATHSAQLSLGLALSALGVLFLGVFPSWWITLGKAAMESLAGS
jgi:NADH-quinone oxidoreductase subunit N